MLDPSSLTLKLRPLRQRDTHKPYVTRIVLGRLGPFVGLGHALGDAGLKFRVQGRQGATRVPIIAQGKHTRPTGWARPAPAASMAMNAMSTAPVSSGTLEALTTSEKVTVQGSYPRATPLCRPLLLCLLIDVVLSRMIVAIQTHFGFPVNGVIPSRWARSPTWDDGLPHPCQARAP